MAFFKTSNTRIAGISACVPEKIISNHDYHWVSHKERELLIKTTGVENKHVVNRNKITTTGDLSFVAAEQLIRELNWDRNEIELLIFISQSRDYVLPHTSAILQERLSLPKSCVAFDISLGCTAFVYGLSVINNMISNGHIKKGLLIMGDISSTGSFRDKSTYPLFGDAGTVTAVEFKEGCSDSLFNLQTDGKGYDAIIVPDGAARNPAKKSSFDYKSYGKGIYRSRMHSALNGIDVFNFCLREVSPNIEALLSQFNIAKDDIDYFIFHQANKLINDTIRRKLGMRREKFPSSLKDYGNTSSATIPLTIVTQLQEEVKNNKLRLLFSGFGVGLSWGSVIVESDKMICPDLLIYENEIHKYPRKRYI